MCPRRWNRSPRSRRLVQPSARPASPSTARRAAGPRSMHPLVVRSICWHSRSERNLPSVMRSGRKGAWNGEADNGSERRGVGGGVGVDQQPGSWSRRRSETSSSSTVCRSRTRSSGATTRSTCCAAIDVFLNCVPGASMLAMRNGLRSVGVDARTSSPCTDPKADSAQLMLTANTVTTYGTAFSTCAATARR